jgi:SpoIID/LytB domain protein
MAEMGHDYQEILAHYYRGTSIGTIAPQTTLWVNLERNFTTKTLTVGNTGASPGANVVITGEPGSLTAGPGTTVVTALIGTDGCSVTVTPPGGTPVALTDPVSCSFDFSWYEWANPAVSPTTYVGISGCTNTDWNVSPSQLRPCQYARGTLHLRYGPGGLDLSAEMLMEDYVLGISEVPPSWPTEALRSQAVAARSYAENRRLVRGDPASNSCDGWCHVKDTTADQRYVGWGHSNLANWIAAAGATAGQVVTHPTYVHGVIPTYYSSSSGGATEYGHEKGFTSGPVEWLTSVNDSWALDEGNGNASWTKTVAAATVASKLGWDFLTSVEVSATRPGSGSAKEVEYWGIDGGQAVSAIRTGGWTLSNLGLKSEYFSVDFRLPGEEMLFYDGGGGFSYRDANADGTLGSIINSGAGYTPGWSSIAAVDLDGDGQDEIFFYRSDGLFRYYEIDPNANVGAPVLAGSGYTSGWSSISAVDLDGDGEDEMFFYREDGLFRYYDISPGGAIGSPIKGGSGYTSGWSSITAVDLDGDGQDEMFFYREDGLFRYYDIRPNGTIGSPILGGTGYAAGWDVIRAVDLDGDGQDEMFFYNEDGSYRYYNVQPGGALGSPIRTGTDYAVGWDVISSIDIDGF